MAEVSNNITGHKNFAKECTDLANEVDAAIQKYAVIEHTKYGKVFAFEVDGFGNATIMDDVNVPSLLALPYLGTVQLNDPIYQNTRKLVWRDDNPYFFIGKTAEGIGGPHVGFDMIWPWALLCAP